MGNKPKIGQRKQLVPVNSKITVVISFYEERSIKPLKELVTTMAQFPAGMHYETLLVVNRTREGRMDAFIENFPGRVISQPNQGMNIGAWDFGWRNCDSDQFLFLQDECFIKRENWLASFSQKLEQKDVGLVGESLNHAWNHDWDFLRERNNSISIKDHWVDGVPTNRVDVYLDLMGKNKIPPGNSGIHLRSLVWATKRSVLEIIGGFIVGQNYGECIGSEIAVTKSVEAHTLSVLQNNSDDSFYFIGHKEWEFDKKKRVWRQNQSYKENKLNEKKAIATDAEGRTFTPYVENLSNQDLERLNDMLPWQCFTLDSKGRKFGKAASDVKRNSPQVIPDKRISDLDKRVNLKGLNVLEIGCFEGIHTIALAQCGAHVTAIDSRIENVVKTTVRTWSFGFLVKAFTCDVESEQQNELIENFDVLHHVGVLYHLVDPVLHLHRLLPKIGKAIMLDTHVAPEGSAKRMYTVDGKEYAYMHYREGGRADAFSGMYDHAKWLRLEDLKTVLSDCGFTDIDVARLREERNGPRVLIYANRPSKS
jgi:2-polyprenyl-3-methyl-5-hydroxy-6-metoxy-1,4-benzoquinol methylase